MLFSPHSGKCRALRDVIVLHAHMIVPSSLAAELKRLENFHFRKKTNPEAVPGVNERCVLIGEESQWYRVR